MKVEIRTAVQADAHAIVSLIRELAEHLCETSGVNEDAVASFVANPECGALVAESEGCIVGVLTFMSFPDLYHAAVSGQIRELAVSKGARGTGVGRLLVGRFLEHARSAGWAEVSVSTMADERGAAEFYRSVGFADEALLLEYHFPIA